MSEAVVDMCQEVKWVRQLMCETVGDMCQM